MCGASHPGGAFERATSPRSVVNSRNVPAGPTAASLALRMAAASSASRNASTSIRRLLAPTETEVAQLAEVLGLMQQHGVSELDAAFKVAEKIDRARGIESPALALP